ncbi:MAG: peroxiredoxin [Planctomycetes bacterium]|nr:peroxiredoxin [Planctomycetota bacterium]
MRVRYMLLPLALVALAVSPARGEEGKAEGKKEAINVGDAIPEVAGKDEAGADLKLSDLKDKQGIVLFFFPKADTPGCTVESCGFRDEAAKFEAAGFKLVGASRDQPEALKAFKEKYKLEYTFLSDPKSEAAGVFGFAPGQRKTALIGKDGKLVKIYDKVTPKGHPAEVLADIEKLNQEGGKKE